MHIFDAACHRRAAYRNQPHYMAKGKGARTLDPLIKSQLLYQLSYGVAFPLFAVQG